MTATSPESIIMTLLEQIRSLEDERDKALQLANQLNETESDSKQRQQQTGSTDKAMESAQLNDKIETETVMETILSELEEIRLNEEQRQFNLEELRKEKGTKGDEDNDDENAKEMLEMCKKYYGKMVSDLQKERNSLQKKVEVQQNQLLEKDMIIAELKMKLGKFK